MTTTTSSSGIDRVLDDVLYAVLREHTVAARVRNEVQCSCGQSFDRRNGRSGLARYTRHVAWATAWSLRENGYAYVGDSA